MEKKESAPVIELTLKVKGVTIKLSVEDAKGLYEALGKVVGEKTYTVTTYPSVVYPWAYTYPLKPPYTVWSSADNLSSVTASYSNEVHP